jgi:hypothetical protein
MSNPQKIKGTAFENLATDLLNKLIKKSRWKRIPGSGALGTIMKESFLTSDINGKVDSIGKGFKVEAKVGYGGKTQFTLKKEWLDKIAEEASASYSIPMLVGKFLGSREGTKVFVVLDIEVFAELINIITELVEDQNE